jgi:hypothetical protein
VASGIKVDGIDNFNKKLLEMQAKANLGSRRIVEQGGVLIANAAKQEFSAGGGDPMPPHPTKRSGMLQASIITQHIEENGTGWSSETGPTTVYGRRIELGYPPGGTGPGHQMTRPFPFLAPGFSNALPDISALAKLVWAETARP